MTIEEMQIKLGELAMYAHQKGWDDDYTEAVNKVDECIKELQAYKEAWNKMQEEIEKINPDDNSYSVKNNACLIVNMYKPKGKNGLNYNTKQCSECGFSLPLYSKFCMNCGAFIEEGDAE